MRSEEDKKKPNKLFFFRKVFVQP